MATICGDTLNGEVPVYLPYLEYDHVPTVAHNLAAEVQSEDSETLRHDVAWTSPPRRTTKR